MSLLESQTVRFSTILNATRVRYETIDSAARATWESNTAMHDTRFSRMDTELDGQIEDLRRQLSQLIVN